MKMDVNNTNLKLLAAALVILTGLYFIPFKSSQVQPAAVLYPNGGEQLQTGNTYGFSWTPDKGVLKMQFVSEKSGETITFYTVTPIYNVAYGRYDGDTSGYLSAELNPIWFKAGGGLYRLKMIFDDGSEDVSDKPFTVVVIKTIAPEAIPETVPEDQQSLPTSPIPSVPIPVEKTQPTPAKKSAPVFPKSTPPAESKPPIPAKQIFQPVQSPKTSTKTEIKKEEKIRIFSRFRSFLRSIFTRDKNQEQPFQGQYK